MPTISKDEGTNTYTLSAAKEAESFAVFQALNEEFMAMTFVFDWSLVAAGANVIDLGMNPGVTSQLADQQDGRLILDAQAAQVASQPIQHQVILGPMVTVIDPGHDSSALGPMGVTPGVQSLGVQDALDMSVGPLTAAAAMTEGARSNASSSNNRLAA